MTLSASIFIQRINYFIYRVFHPYSSRFIVHRLSFFLNTRSLLITRTPHFVDFQPCEPSWFTFSKNHSLQIVVNKRITKSVNVKDAFQL